MCWLARRRGRGRGGGWDIAIFLGSGHLDFCLVRVSTFDCAGVLSFGDDSIPDHRGGGAVGLPIILELEVVRDDARDNGGSHACATLVSTFGVACISS